ncbi:MAG: hypothetical protein EOO61_05855 [Hymenobacter sp.]|nr:MAG: hypothetical protein EOO61_05855 [Hymenobacter sp.]
MTDSKLDADGYTEEIRRSIVDKAMTRVRAHQVEPEVGVIAIYDQYIIGTISRQEAGSLMLDRLELLYNRVASQEERRACWK